MNRNAVEQEALARAVNSPSLSNYPAIFAGFMAKGIPEADIQPRVNVFSFHAWKALGRSVKKGEHGVKIATVRKGEKTVKGEDGTESKVGFSSPWYVTVFHVTQTKETGAPIDSDSAADTGSHAEVEPEEAPKPHNPDAPSKERMAQMRLERAAAVQFSEEFTQIK